MAELNIDASLVKNNKLVQAEERLVEVRRLRGCGGVGGREQGCQAGATMGGN